MIPSPPPWAAKGGLPSGVGAVRAIGIEVEVGRCQINGRRGRDTAASLEMLAVVNAWIAFWVVDRRVMHPLHRTTGDDGVHITEGGRVDVLSVCDHLGGAMGN